jgi:hypothetical protein
MKLFTVICLLLLLSSCGDSPADAESSAKVFFTSQQADLFIQQLKTKAPYKIGQQKKIWQDLRKTVSSTICYYWEDRIIEIIDVKTATLQLNVDSKSTLMETKDSKCPTTNNDDFNRTQEMSKEEYERISSRFVKYYIDHNFRCSELKSCKSSKFISSKEADLKGIATVLVTTEYAYDNGEVAELQAWISTRNLFEGVLKYQLINKETNQWWSKRGFFSAIY